MVAISTCIWFDRQALEAAEFYTALVPDSQILSTLYYPEGGMGEPGSVLTVDLELAGVPYVFLNGGPLFPQSEAVSIVLEVDTQAEIDHYWVALLADGGAESQCGWLKDKFGVSWQVVPADMDQLWGDDPDAAARVNAALMPMIKIDLEKLLDAARGGTGAAY